MADSNFTVIDGREVALIRVPKCASRSLARALGLGSPWGHLPRRELERRYPEKNPLFIACIRNPFDRLVSWHSYHAEADHDLCWGRGVNGFREWVATGCPNRFAPASPEAHPFEQWRWLEGSRGELRVLRFEHLDEDWEKLGLGAPLLHADQSDHTDWRDYYDAPTRQRAENILWNDLTRFDFSV